MTLDDCKKLATDLMAKHGLTGWTFKFDHARQRLGCCKPYRRQISLSKHYVQNNRDELVLDTILHEIAHALTPGHHHDDVWKAECVRIGARPIRCKDTVEDKLVSAEGKWVADCAGCGVRHYLHKSRRGRMPTGYMCRRTRQSLVFRPNLGRDFDPVTMFD